MSKEMLFLCDVYDAWLSKNKLPHRCASEILYGADTKGRLTQNQSYWLESFMLRDLLTIWKQRTWFNM